MTASTVPEKGASQEQINAHIAYLLGEMSLDEKVYMMSGHGFLPSIWRAIKSGRPIPIRRVVGVIA